MAFGLAQALQEGDHKVALLDVNIHGSALPRALRVVRDPSPEPLLGCRLRLVIYEGLQPLLLIPTDHPELHHYSDYDQNGEKR